MGDKQRFHIFATFIAQTFPDALSVADVAGGHGELAFRLQTYGKRPVIIDPRAATFPRWIHRTLRKQRLRTGKSTIIERCCSEVSQVDLSSFDLIVALHPDQATEPTLRMAVKYDIDFALVPCCVFPLDGIRRSKQEWVHYLQAIAPNIQRSQLPITGANIVLWRKSSK